MPKFTPTPKKLSNQKLKVILSFACGMFLFSALDTIAKLLTESFHPIQVAWSRTLGLLLGIFILLLFKGISILHTNHPWMQIFRGLLAATSAIFFIFALSVVPIADAVAVSFVAPFFVTIFLPSYWPDRAFSCSCIVLSILTSDRKMSSMADSSICS